MIKFPKMHIAASVVNRILNVRDDMTNGRQTLDIPTGTRAPDVPDPQRLGVGIEEAIATPAAPLPGADRGGDGAAAVASIAEGGTALQGLIANQSEEGLL
jgi:hypothetical protein